VSDSDQLLREICNFNALEIIVENEDSSSENNNEDTNNTSEEESFAQICEIINDIKTLFSSSFCLKVEQA